MKSEKSKPGGMSKSEQASALLQFDIVPPLGEYRIRLNASVCSFKPLKNLIALLKFEISRYYQQTMLPESLY